MLPMGGVGLAAGRLATPFPNEGLPGTDGLAIGPIPGNEDEPPNPPFPMEGPGRDATGGDGRAKGAGWETAGRAPMPGFAGLAAGDGPGAGRDIDGTDGAEGRATGPGRPDAPGRIGWAVTIRAAKLAERKTTMGSRNRIIASPLSG